MSTENQATTYRTRSNRKKFLMGSGLSALAGCFMMSAAAAQKPAEPVKEFHIAAQSLDAALKSYAFTTNKQVMFTTDIVEGKQATPVEGEMTDAEALQKLLAGSGLVFETRNTNVVLVRTAEQQAVIDRGAGATAVEEVQQVRPLDSKGDVTETRKTPDEITVTGTNIRGFAPESSPLQVFNRQDIEKAGSSSLEDFMRREIPQNFGGGSTEYAPGGLPNDRNSQANNTHGSGANLRGLGSRGTLVLLNGNRLAPSSTIGDFVDLSMIPISAIERVDVLTDGASSIYGGDAVAGVVNFVLRDDFEGAETALRYGTVTSGEMREYRLSQTAGANWTSGNILATYEFFDRDNLTLADRPGIAAPTISSGDPILTTESFDLMPEHQKHSAVVSLSQELTPALSIQTAAIYSRRKTQSTTSTAGAASAIQRSDTKSENISANVAADYKISDRWSAKIGGTFSRVVGDEAYRNFSVPDPVPYNYRSESELWSVDLSASGDLLSLPGGDVKVAFGGQYRNERFTNGVDVLPTLSSDGQRDVAAAFGELALPIVGSNNAVTAIRRLELVTSARLDDYSDFGTTINPKVGVIWSPANAFNVRGSYSTSFAPPALGRAGALDRIAAVFPYDWILNNFGVEAPDPSLAGTNYLATSGTAANLDPETARTYTFGVDYSRDVGDSSWKANATYYDVRFQDRLGATPIPDNLNPNLAPSLAWNDPGLFPAGTVVFFPTTDEIESVFSSLVRPPNLLFGASLDNIQIINNANIVRNLSSTQTRGVELQLGYAIDEAFGRITVDLNANYIIDFQQQASSTTPKVDVINTLYNPVDLRLRGNLGYSRDNFRANAYINYTDSYRSDTSESAQPISSWTTIDLFMSYSIVGSSWLNGTSLNFAVTNIFNQSPPRTPTYGTYILAGYDPTNASPLKRFVSIELRKQF